MKKVYYIIFLSFLTVTCSAQSVYPFEDFKNEIRTHWTRAQYSKSIDLLLAGRSNYPGDMEQHLITYYLGLLYLEIHDYENSFKVFNGGFDQLYFFSFWPDHLTKIRQHTNGEKIIERNNANRAIYLKEAYARYKVILPENYSSKLTYPLFYFLHGNNSNLEYLTNKFQNIELTDDVIIVLAQSSYARSNYSFDWVDSVSSKNSLIKIHSNVSKNYSVDSSKIIVGGFSNGGRMAIDILVDEVIPSLGFIAFNPSKTTINSTRIVSGKGVIITGEMDYLLSEQIDLAGTLYDLSFPLRLVVLPDHDHDYPNTFAQELNKSIQFILKND